MKKIFSLLLCTVLLFTVLTSCKNKAPEKEIKNILFLGDDLMHTSEVYSYFADMCKTNGKDAITVDYEVIDDARMYTFAALCKTDESFASRVKKADMIIFEEGTAETQTTAESIQTIRSFANEPTVVCLCIYGYPCWMYREMFEEKGINDIKYSDSDYFIKKIIAADDYPIGYEHLCYDDYIHPNELNGYLAALVTFCECFNTTPEKIDVSYFNDNEKLSNCADIELDNLPGLLNKLSEMINNEM